MRKFSFLFHQWTLPIRVFSSLVPNTYQWSLYSNILNERRNSFPLIKTAEVKTFQELISEPEGRIWKAKERPVY